MAARRKMTRKPYSASSSKQPDEAKEEPQPKRQRIKRKANRTYIPRSEAFESDEENVDIDNPVETMAKDVAGAGAIEQTIGAPAVIPTETETAYAIFADMAPETEAAPAETCNVAERATETEAIEEMVELAGEMADISSEREANEEAELAELAGEKADIPETEAIEEMAEISSEREAIEEAELAELAGEMADISERDAIEEAGCNVTEMATEAQLHSSANTGNPATEIEEEVDDIIAAVLLAINEAEVADFPGGIEPTEKDDGTDVCEMATEAQLHSSTDTFEEQVDDVTAAVAVAKGKRKCHLAKTNKQKGKEILSGAPKRKKKGKEKSTAASTKKLKEIGVQSRSATKGGAEKFMAEAIRHGLKKNRSGPNAPSCTRSISSKNTSQNIPLSKCPTVRCNLRKFRSLVKSLNSAQRGWVQMMGFNSLLVLSVRQLDQHLCYWLMQRFDPNTRQLEIRNDYFALIDESDVGWVLGIPEGPLNVPANTARQGRVEKLKEDYENKNGISEDFLRQKIKDGNERRQFQSDFLLYVLGVLLCPTQSNKISPLHLRALCIKESFDNYNWCRYVLDWLVRFAQKFKADVRKTGYGGGLGGCAVFLMIFYLDRLDRGYAVNWDVEDHRAKAWDMKEVKAAIESDRLDKWRFGQSKVVRDVVYGNPYPIGAKKSWAAIQKCKKMSLYLSESSSTGGESEDRGCENTSSYADSADDRPCNVDSDDSGNEDDSS